MNNTLKFRNAFSSNASLILKTAVHNLLFPLHFRLPYGKNIPHKVIMNATCFTKLLFYDLTVCETQDLFIYSRRFIVHAENNVREWTNFNQIYRNFEVTSLEICFFTHNDGQWVHHILGEINIFCTRFSTIYSKSEVETNSFMSPWIWYSCY